MAIHLDENTKNWILDRVENNEPLFYKEFVIFMADLGYDVDEYLTKSYKNAVKKKYAEVKLAYKKERELF